jgi:hypothetical protein
MQLQHPRDRRPGYAQRVDSYATLMGVEIIYADEWIGDEHSAAPRSGSADMMVAYPEA